MDICRHRELRSRRRASPPKIFVASMRSQAVGNQAVGKQPHKTQQESKHCGILHSLEEDRQGIMKRTLGLKSDSRLTFETALLSGHLSLLTAKNARKNGECEQVERLTPVWKHSFQGPRPKRGWSCPAASSSSFEELVRVPAEDVSRAPGTMVQASPLEQPENLMPITDISI